MIDTNEDQLELRLPVWIRNVNGLGGLTPLHLFVVGMLIGFMIGILTYPLNP